MHEKGIGVKRGGVGGKGQRGLKHGMFHRPSFGPSCPHVGIHAELP